MNGEESNKSNLKRTLAAIRVTEEVYEFYVRKADRERRRCISEAVRIALEDYATQHADEREPAAA